MQVEKIGKDRRIITLSSSDTLLKASELERQIKKFAEEIFFVIQYENCNLEVRRFLTPVILRLQMKWILTQNGVIHVSVPHEGFYQYFLGVNWEDFYDEIEIDDAAKIIDKRIDHIFAVMRGRGRKFSTVRLLEIPSEGRLDFSLCAINNPNYNDPGLIPWSWL
ncbi:MAG: hypothetical protein WC087_02225 [Candidatus Paceibacterota bacterium]